MKKTLWWAVVILLCPLWAPFTLFYLVRSIGEVMARVLVEVYE
jgi:hypothetical protein